MYSRYCITKGIPSSKRTPGGRRPRITKKTFGFGETTFGADLGGRIWLMFDRRSRLPQSAFGYAVPRPAAFSRGPEERVSPHFGYSPASSRMRSISSSCRESGMGIGSTPAGRAAESLGTCIVGVGSEAKRSTDTNGSDVRQVDTRHRPNLTPRSSNATIV